jgi:NAD(P)-dependent dehydrogenase (short-subunit alcohol dehydrogenase family)
MLLVSKENEPMALWNQSDRLNCLVVAGAGGIGFEFVRQLLDKPNVEHVFATYHNPTTLENLKHLQTLNPQRLELISMDITQQDQVIAMVEQLKQEINCLHLVINCVGLLHRDRLQPEKSLNHINPDQLQAYFAINSIGPLLIASHLMDLFRQTSQPSLLATISAKVGSIEDNRLGGWYGYRASKAALNMFMKNVAIEYRRKAKQTAVVVLHPGTTDTQLSSPFQRNVPPEKLFSPHKTVSLLWDVIEKITLDDTGKFFSWDGSEIPW